MICTSLAGPDPESCRRALTGLDFAEIRLEALDIDPAGARALFASHPRLVATCRPGVRPEAERRALLRAAVDGGAAYLDLELEADPETFAVLSGLARRRGCALIVSHHDFERTPGRTELEALRRRCFAAGADIAKLACQVAEPRDCARLLALLQDGPPTVAIGMGPLGAVTRLAAPLLGAPFTYACLAAGAETAPGQIDRARLAGLLEELRR